MMEVGPFRTVPASKTDSGEVELELVDGGWEEFGTMVFSKSPVDVPIYDPLIRSAPTIVDQPPGTGLSIVPTNGYLHELDQASAHMIQFLKNFYTVFPELQTLSVSQQHILCGVSLRG